MIIAGTGHRPDKLGGYGMQTHLKLVELAKDDLVLRMKTKKVISGMAQGWDLGLAQAALELKIPLVAAIPCQGQTSRWPADAKNLYEKILKQAAEVVMVSDEPFKPWLMQKRNIWMVDQCDILLALYDGSDGGTGNCLEYANKVNKKGERQVEIVNLWDQFTSKGTPF